MCFTVATREGRQPWEILVQQWLSYVTESFTLWPPEEPLRNIIRNTQNCLWVCPFSLWFRREKDKATRPWGPLTQEMSLFNHQGQDGDLRVRMEQGTCVVLKHCLSCHCCVCLVWPGLLSKHASCSVPPEFWGWCLSNYLFSSPLSIFSFLWLVAKTTRVIEL